ncbi:hypothetical protein KXV51_004393 [Aspergillus fumigatus]|nr:hypothetical protein CNMCM8689_006140 [Aspergillus fumigatus]KAH1415890.1 hypothetical protein KXX64_005332 [Aspergillus fumigatus]KAH1613825.1 hypothetical protein KXX31_004237 [Aspergillus fumigatus]KAH1810744.1 hypothetical protein KXX19_007150 [Aspergillus fumigatus]KAH2007584.1 hypothetical protein KXV97_002535 [Aspergillus fumigatus]
MKFTALLCTLIVATAVSASTVPRDEFQIQDTCGSGYGGDQRRLVWYVNPSQLEDETSFAHGYSFKKVECRNGRWTEIQDCHASTCHGTNDGAARC